MHTVNVSSLTVLQARLRAVVQASPVIFSNMVANRRYPDVSLHLNSSQHPRDCAVLILVHPKAGRPRLLAIQRAACVKTFPTSVAFPGGGKNPGESDEQGALREFEEELGVRLPESVILGRLPTIGSAASGKAVKITAVLGAVEILPKLTPNRVEVAAILDLALLPPCDDNKNRATMSGMMRFLYDGVCAAFFK
jgi:8-oxo-dGTP pyrophosphatase MutT (NUDIX family)